MLTSLPSRCGWMIGTTGSTKGRQFYHDSCCHHRHHVANLGMSSWSSWYYSKMIIPRRFLLMKNHIAVRKRKFSNHYNSISAPVMRTNHYSKINPLSHRRFHWNTPLPPRPTVTKSTPPFTSSLLWGIGSGTVGCLLFLTVLSPTSSSSSLSTMQIKTTTLCEALILREKEDSDEDEDDDTMALVPPQQQHQDTTTTTATTTILSKVKRAIRMIRRILKLMIVFTPVVILYPLPWMIQFASNHLLAITKTTTMSSSLVDAQELVLRSLEQQQQQQLQQHCNNMIGPWGWYYRIVLNAVERSGAALIKIMQWAGSRPDMFGSEFCAVFSQLQDDTTPHAWIYTEQALIDAYGESWRDHIEMGDILGSGCIAQVYKGYIRTAANNSTNNGTKQKRPVAIKVMHPNVEDDIDADLDILRVTVRLMEYLDFGPLKDLKWLNLPGFIEEMADMLKIQLDLRTEGRHLVQFDHNFEGNDTVIFPKLVEEYPPVKNVLVETFCEGVPIMVFINNNKADRDLLTKMCTGAIRAVCQMIFLGTFMETYALFCHPLNNTGSLIYLSLSFFVVSIKNLCHADNFTHGTSKGRLLKK
jgi:hypothetical protein